MHSLVYISRAEVHFTDQELLQLLEQSRQKNLRLQVTGLLLYKDGNFMQLLEGEESIVRPLYDIIKADIRHCSVNLLFEGPVETRQYPTWSMGFKNLDSIDPRAVPGYNQFLNVPLTKEEFSSDPSRSQQLLLLFKKLG